MDFRSYSVNLINTDIRENLNSGTSFNYLFVVERENKQQNLKTRDRCEINTEKLGQNELLYLKIRKGYIKFIQMHDF